MIFFKFVSKDFLEEDGLSLRSLAAHPLQIVQTLTDWEVTICYAYAILKRVVRREYAWGVA